MRYPLSKALGMCVAGGVLVAAGLGALTWGSQLVFDELDMAQGMVEPGGGVTASKYMDAGQPGVYAVESPDLDSVRAVLYGPEGVISDQMHGRGASEGLFEAVRDGVYELEVSNEGDVEGFLAGYVGPQPDAEQMSVAFISIYVLVAGMGLFAGGLVYAVISRRRVS